MPLGLAGASPERSRLDLVDHGVVEVVGWGRCPLPEGIDRLARLIRYRVPSPPLLTVPSCIGRIVDVISGAHVTRAAADAAASVNAATIGAAVGRSKLCGSSRLRRGLGPPGKPLTARASSKALRGKQQGAAPAGPPQPLRRLAAGPRPRDEPACGATAHPASRRERALHTARRSRVPARARASVRGEVKTSWRTPISRNRETSRALAGFSVTIATRALARGACSPWPEALLDCAPRPAPASLARLHRPTNAREGACARPPAEA